MSEESPPPSKWWVFWKLFCFCRGRIFPNTFCISPPSEHHSACLPFLLLIWNSFHIPPRLQVQLFRDPPAPPWQWNRLFKALSHTLPTVWFWSAAGEDLMGGEFWWDTRSKFGIRDACEKMCENVLVLAHEETCFDLQCYASAMLLKPWQDKPGLNPRIDFIDLMGQGIAFWVN